MNYDCDIHQSYAMEPANLSLFDPDQPQPGADEPAIETLAEDERFPGTFFRIPRVPIPGKTAWVLTK